MLPENSEDRKNTPLFSGVLRYFPLALAAVARVSKKGNDKHNAGEPLHWSREKSGDHLDCVARHLADVGRFDTDGELHDAHLAWRALANLQIAEENRLAVGAAYATAPASALDETPVSFTWSAPAVQAVHDHWDCTGFPAEPPPSHPFTFYYLATPDTKYPPGHMMAFEMASHAAAVLMDAGVPVFSPIAHSHPIAQHMPMSSATDHDLWMKMDGPLMEAASGLIVYRAKGWDQSSGVAEEISRFEAAGKPVVYWDPGSPIPWRVKFDAGVE